MNGSIYDEPPYVQYNVRTVPNQNEWKSAPAEHASAAEVRNPAGLSPRAKAAIGAAGVVLAASGAFAWSSYASASARADVQKAQIALEQRKLDLQQAQQAADLAKSAGQETEAQKARRVAVSECVAKAGGGFGAVDDCGKAFPLIETPGMQTASQTINNADHGQPINGTGLVVLGTVAAGAGALWLKRRYARP